MAAHRSESTYLNAVGVGFRAWCTMPREPTVLLFFRVMHAER
jgi:hypothetical protein